MKLPPISCEFITHFGEMGSRWGVNRSLAQVYALLFLSQKPLNADDIVDVLGISRSNVASSIKDLVGMKLILLKHFPKDRKDYYVAKSDICDLIRTIVEVRRKREIEPTLDILKNMVDRDHITAEETYAHTKIYEMYDVIDDLTSWYKEITQLESEKLMNLIKMGKKVYGLYQLKDKIMKGSAKSNKREVIDA